MSGFQKIYIEYAKPVYRFLLSLVGSEDLAEELLQETFYQAFLHINRFEERCSLYSWLCQIGKNAWLKECRKNKRYTTMSWDDLTIPDNAPALDEKIIINDTYKRIQYAIRQLSDPYREVFVLHAIGEIPLKEIACMFQKSESWARVTYFRAKQQIIQEVTK